MTAAGDVTRLLRAWGGGESLALDGLMDLVYGELRNLAGRLLAGERADHTLQPTALIHEAYLKLERLDGYHFVNRTDFVAFASVAMRQVLVNHAKATLTAKRGFGQPTLALDSLEIAAHTEAREVLALHEALIRLEVLAPRKCRVVEMRYFGGMDLDEIASALRISSKTVTRDWQSARLWLARELGARQESTS